MLTRKQKLVFKSIKVFIKFKSGVFICNSCAISGWKLNFWQSWMVVKIDVNWMISGWIMNILTQKLCIQKVKFQSSFFTQISTNWWLDKNWDSKVEFKSSFCTQISFSWMISEWFMNMLTQKLGFKMLSLIHVFSPRFYPVCDLVKTGIKKIEFKLCNQISPSWWLDFKSGVKVKFKWSSKVEFWNPSF